VVTEPAISGPTDCPDQATLLAALKASDDPGADSVHLDPWQTLCSGEWAFTAMRLQSPSGELDAEGQPLAWSLPYLFRWDGGTWTYVDRTGPCKSGQIPEDMWALTCNSG
jgi:hypothetical protein